MKPNQALEYSTVRDPRGRDFADLHAIYESAFPASERKSREALEAMVLRADYRFIVARNPQGIAGFAVLFASSAAGVALLEYLAVAERFRSLGIGASLFEHAWRSLVESTGSDALIIEVESDGAGSADRQVGARRKDFYRRLGCREVMDLQYILPLRGPAPPPMELMVRSRHDAISKARLRAWLAAIYEDVYDCSPDDPRIDEMLAAHETYKLS